MMKAKYFVLLVGAVLIVGTASAATMSPNGLDSTPFTSGATAVLYDQLDNASGNGAPDQAFEVSYEAYSAEGADDFEVTDTEGWDVDGSAAPGTGGNSSFVNVAFYADAGGVPAAAPESGCEYLGLTTYTDTLGDLEITFPACNLGPGMYWYAQQVRQDFNPNGQHFWSNRAIISNSPAVWRNPGDGFATGCVAWEEMQICRVGGGFPDFLFQILGEVRTGGTSTTGGGVPAVGPFGMLMMVLALGGGSGYVLARRRRS